MNVVRLVKRAKKGNKEALLQLVMAEKDRYYRLALTYMGNPHDAMDAMEDMIVTLYETIDQLQKEDAFYSWSNTILVNRCKRMLSKQQKLMHAKEWKEEDTNRYSTFIDPFIQREQHLDIMRLLDHLNEQQKEAIQLKYFHDLDYQTIAMMTNVSVGTVKSRVFQGLKKLREHVGGDYHE